MVFDCFTFFNEIDLLEIRLNVLNDVVDKFVIVEATTTHQGKPKPLYFRNDESRFGSFREKIIYVVADDLPANGSAWDRENFQRNCISRGLTNCKPTDVVIISDLDEIPDPKKIRQFQNEPGVKVFQQKNFYYYLNCVALDEEWYGSVMAFYEDVHKPQNARDLAKEMHARNKKILKRPLQRFFRSIRNPVLRKKITLIDEGGWQFGYLGGAEKVIQKIEAFSHAEYNKEKFTNKNAVLENIQSGKDLFGRDLKYTFVDIDDSFPDYIVQHKEDLKHLIR